jgi:hypothetical protein
MKRTTASLIGALTMFACLASAPARAQSCVGDCRDTGQVSVADLILGINIAFGLQPVSACPSFQNAQGQVDIAQLITGVNNSLDGCPSTPTVTATHTTTPTLTAIGTATITTTPTSTGTPAGTATATVTATGTPAGTATATVTATGTPAGTASATVTVTKTGAVTATKTATATGTPAGTATATITTTPTPTATPPVGCGDLTITGNEQCDPPGSSCGPGATCQSDCTCPCDFLDASNCLFPFPSDYLTVADESTDTTRRVHFATDTMPRNVMNTPIAPADYNLNDGFSPGASILLHVPGVDLAMTGAVPITDIARSLDADAPIVLVNASTLEHHLFWAELDSNAMAEATRALILRPAVDLTEGARYIVALRRMKDGTGGTIQPGADFIAYRDNTPTGVPFKEARRPHMEEIFSTLTAAGVERNDLYLAWDFTVASSRNLTERVLFMRDDGFSRLNGEAPKFTVTKVEDDVDTNIFRRVTGTYEVDRYVDSQTPPARLVLGPDGLPVHQTDPQVASFICIVPRAALANAGATATPARASIYGHGLLGSNDEVNAGNVEDMANEHNFVFCATKWIGMADEDVANAVDILKDLGKFPTLTDRLQQAMLNQLYLARLMIHADGFISNAAFQDGEGHPVIDTSAVFYDGNSQGGIFGGTVVAISQDITRGVLGVPGMNYSLLLTRSTDFAIYAGLLYPAYPNEFDRPLGLALIQMLWDRSDPNGYAQHMTDDPLPNTPPHKVLLHLAFGDHQVANVATEVETRTIGASIHQPAIAAGRHSDVTPYFDIPAIPSYPFDGSALIVWDSGAVTPPITNKAPSMGRDPHPDPRSSPDARQQKSDFLKTDGAVVDVCSGAPCVAPPAP